MLDCNSAYVVNSLTRDQAPMRMAGEIEQAANSHERLWRDPFDATFRSRQSRSYTGANAYAVTVTSGVNSASHRFT